jgi:hypothetical protein
MKEGRKEGKKERKKEGRGCRQLSSSPPSSFVSFPSLPANYW